MKISIAVTEVETGITYGLEATIEDWKKYGSVFRLTNNHNYKISIEQIDRLPVIRQQK